MPGVLRSGGWQDRSGGLSDGVSSDYGQRGAVMDAVKAVCISYLGVVRYTN